MLEFIDLIQRRCFEQDIVLILLRPREMREPDIYEGDFDFFLHASCVDQFFSCVHGLCTASSRSFSIQRIKLDKYLLIFWSNDGMQRVVFDVWTSLEFRDESGRGVISNEHLAPHVRAVDGSHVFDHDFSHLLYLSHLGSKGRNIHSDNVGDRLSYYHQRSAESQYVFLRTIVTEDQCLQKTIAQANEVLVAKGLVDCSSRSRVARRMFKMQLRRMRRSSLIAVLGPDGSGKTTVIAMMTKFRRRIGGFRFKRMYRRSLIYKFAMPFLRSSADRLIGADDKPQRNQVEDVHVSFMRRIACVRIRVWLLLFGWWRVHIMDRYFPDLLIQGSRLAWEQLRVHPSWRGYMRRVPTPRLYVQVDARTETILQRKEELLPKTIDAFRTWYFRMATAGVFPHYLYLSTDASRDVCEKVIDDVMKQI